MTNSLLGLHTRFGYEISPSSFFCETADDLNFKKFRIKPRFFKTLSLNGINHINCINSKPKLMETEIIRDYSEYFHSFSQTV